METISVYDKGGKQQLPKSADKHGVGAGSRSRNLSLGCSPGFDKENDQLSNSADEHNDEHDSRSTDNLMERYPNCDEDEEQSLNPDGDAYDDDGFERNTYKEESVSGNFDRGSGF